MRPASVVIYACILKKAADLDNGVLSKGGLTGSQSAARFSIIVLFKLVKRYSAGSENNAASRYKKKDKRRSRPGLAITSASPAAIVLPDAVYTEKPLMSRA